MKSEFLEMSQNKPQVHRIIDDAPFFGSVNSGCVCLMSFWIIRDIIDAPIRMIFPYYPLPGPVGIIVALVLCNRIFICWYKPGTEGLLKGGNWESLPRLLIPIIVYWIVLVSFAVILDGTKLAFPGFAKLSLALSAGVTEEFAFRGAIIAPMMRNQPNRKRILTALVVSSVVFGLVHGANIITGSSPFAVIMQVLVTTAGGCFLGVVFLSTGNLWSVILIHFIQDVIAFSSAGKTADNGMITLAIPLSFWVGLILTVMLVVCAFIEVHRDSSIDRILSIWRNKWEIELVQGEQ